jgi:aminobenzoyl-glutamate transport protein
MSEPNETPKTEAPKGLMQRFLDVVEKVGNKVPHPAIIFLILIGIVLVLSQILYMAGAGVSKYEVIVPETKKVEAPTVTDASTDETATMVTYQTIEKKNKIEAKRDVKVRSLLTGDGIRFMYEELIPNFMSFTAVGLIIVAMLGVGVAEAAGLVNALIRKLVLVSPRWALTYILVFVGILSSIAADAGYLVLIPLAGVAFLSVGRHPLAGLAMGFAAVAAAFTVNMLIKPLDAILTEFTNDAVRLVDSSRQIGLTANLWFSIASVLFLTVVITFITERMIEPRLGKYVKDQPADRDPGSPPATREDQPAEEGGGLSEDESRGLRYAGLALLGVLVVLGLLTLPPGAPLRNPETGALIGNTPFMNGLIAVIMVVFLATGVAYGIGAKTIQSSTDVIKAMEKAVAGLGSLIFLLFIISQFVAFFNYSNMGTILAVSLSDMLQQANFPPLVLLIGFIVVVAILDLLITGAIAKWALFAPIFVPLLMRLGVEPEAVLAAYRIADSPINVITPLNAYFALVVTFCQRYDKNAGVGTVVALMLPYVVILLVLWTALFVVWYLLGLPWGL